MSSRQVAASLVAEPIRRPAPPIVYRESDGKPMAENETQLFLMIALIAHLRARFGGPDAHIGGDMFWYPVEHHPRIVRAPDVFVVFGRPQAPLRRTWKNWEEDGHGLDTVIEVVSPSNTRLHLTRLHNFYDRHGVGEYIVLDPESGRIEINRRRAGRLQPVVGERTAVSIGVRFEADRPAELIRAFEVATGVEIRDVHDILLSSERQIATIDAQSSQLDAQARRIAELEAQLRAMESGDAS